MLDMAKTPTRPADPNPDPEPKKPGKRSWPKETFHLPPDERDALEEYVNDQPNETNKSAVIRRALREFLTREGYVDSPEG